MYMDALIIPSLTQYRRGFASLKKWIA